MIRIARMSVVASAMFALAHAAWAQRPDVRVAQSTKLDEPAPSLLERPARLNIEQVSLEAALNALTQASGVPLAFSPARMPRDARVSCACADVDMRGALDQLLAETSLEYVELSGQIVLFPEDDSQSERGNLLIGMRNPGRLASSIMVGKRDAPGGDHADENGGHTSSTKIMVRNAAASTAWVQIGTIVGTVTEGETSNPIVNAQVAVDGAGRAFTEADGRYRITNIPSGRRSVSVTSIGYRTVTQEVDVVDGATATLDFALDVLPTALADIVVTATGEQRRMEVGNAIGTIDADAVVPASPVRSLTEAIGSRVPGVQILQNTGFAGESPRMRIRGVSSVTGSNQPLIYVDGVRVDNSTGSLRDDRGGFIGNYGHRGGRFNDVNLDEIEKIEIVKGPSAATLYGTDAANGVILITTKRGRAGPARWSFYAEGGLSEPAVDFRDNYFSWGTNMTTGAIERCILVQQAAGNCMADSLTAFQPLNDPETSPIGTGTRGQFGARVSGGADRFRYMLSADYERETGYLEMPELDLQRLREQRGEEDIPEWQNNPNTLEKLSLRANASTTVGKAEINLSTGFVSSTTAIPRGDIFAAGYWGPGFRDAADGWLSLDDRPGEIFAVKKDESTKHYTGSLSTRWQALDWLTVRGTVGIDFSSVFFDGLQRRGEGRGDLTGRRLNIEQSTTLLTADFGSSALFDLAAALSSKTSVGFQYNGRLRRSTTATATGLPPGSETVTGAASSLGAEFERESIVAGAYIEQTFGLNDRLFFTGAIRADGSSSFGDRFDAAAYPKAGVSWLASQEPFFPDLPGLDNLRLRAAWGASGVQPGSTDALALASLFTSLVDGANTNGAALQAIGNPDLKPERSTEIEAGLDAELFGNRLNIEATYYNKLSTDALIDRPLPVSVGVTSRRENIGEVRNRGWEALVSARLVESPLLSWDVMFSGSINHNQLEELDLNATFVGANRASRNREGFPLWSRWDFPILGFDDANGNGIIEPAEVQVGDTVAFMGDANPPRQFTLSTALGLFGERLTVSSLFERRSGHVGMNFSELNACAFFVACRAVNDPTAPLWEQARAVAFNKAGTWAGYMEDASFTRWRELAITYRVPEAFAARFGARSMSVTLSGRNLRLWTNYTSPDPEVNSVAGSLIIQGNSDNPTAPQTRYWMLRVNVGM